MRAIPRLALAIGAAALLGCSGDNAGTNPPGGGAGDGGTSNSVSVRDNFFTPTPASIAVGSTVTWTWRGSNFHNVTFDPNDSPMSPTQVTGTYSRRFDAAGTFTYYCTVHGRAMSGSVLVQ